MPLTLAATSMNTGHRAQSSGSADSACGEANPALSSLLGFNADELGSSGGGNRDMSAAEDINKQREKNRNAQVTTRQRIAGNCTSSLCSALCMHGVDLTAASSSSFGLAQHQHVVRLLRNRLSSPSAACP